MGLFDFFRSSPSPRGLAKLVAKANNKDAQSPDRWRALEQLRDEGSAEAIVGMLRRFSFVYDKTIEDEQEKQWVHDTLVEMARPHDGVDEETAARNRAIILEALERNLLSADTIAWSLKVLEHVASHDETWAILDKVIAANDNEYVRDPSKKIQLITFVGEEFHDPRAARAVVQYLEDMDETVRFNTVEALLHQKDEEAGREPLLKLLVSPTEESRRVKIRILDGFAENGWNTHGYKGQVEEVCQQLGRGHSIDNKGRIKKPAQK